MWTRRPWPDWPGSIPAVVSDRAPQAGRTWREEWKKRAIIAMPRKLVLLLHHQWVSGDHLQDAVEHPLLSHEDHAAFEIKRANRLGVIGGHSDIGVGGRPMPQSDNWPSPV